MQIKSPGLTGICFPGGPPTGSSQWRAAVFVIVFVATLGMIAAGVDIHTAALMMLTAGYVASEIANQLPLAEPGRGTLPIA
ncbi:hypothetical protein [Dactylosporangium sp. NPDC000521]|uniref:hypothetical protein n=1 Tax=Dactylosporangium sp. NPDC000521 TaxID=3363975 RepID=UPI003676F9BA